MVGSSGSLNKDLTKDVHGYASASQAMSAFGAPSDRSTIISEFGAGTPFEALLEAFAARQKRSIQTFGDTELKRLDSVVSDQVRSRGATSGLHARDTELVQQELRADYRSKMEHQVEAAFSHIDRLLLSCMRQLPPNIRSMPIGEAFSMFADDGDASREPLQEPASAERKRTRTIETQTSLYNVKTKKLRSPGAGAASAGQALGAGQAPTTSLTPDLAAMRLAGARERVPLGELSQHADPDISVLAQQVQEMQEKVNGAESALQKMQSSATRFEELARSGQAHERRALLADLERTVEGVR